MFENQTTAVEEKGSVMVESILEDLKIHKTMDYEKFKLLPYNRPVRNSHFKKLTNVIAQNGYEPSYHILVTKDFEIIDGQHRFQACKELGLPIYFTIMKNFNPEDVIYFNNNSIKWSAKDYLNYFVYWKKPNYIKLKNFMEQYSIDVYSAIILIFSMQAHGKFKNGKLLNGALKITNEDLQNGHENIRLAAQFERYLLDWKNIRFLSGLVCLFRHPLYNQKEMFKNLALGRVKLEKCASAHAYRILLQDIYNINKNKNEKVYF